MTSTGPDPRRDDDPTGVRDLLASLPDPGPMPADLVARISAALDAEARDRATSSPEPRELSGATVAEVVPIERARRWSRRRVLGIIAGVAAGIGLVGVVAPNLVSTSPLTSAVAKLDAGTTHSDVSAQQPSTPGASTAGSHAGPEIQVRLSSTPLTSKDLSAYGAGLLARRWTPATPHTVEQPSLGPIGTAEGVRECLTTLEPGPVDRVAAEVTTYQGKPAVVIAARRGTAVTTYVAAIPCYSGHATLLAPPAHA